MPILAERAEMLAQIFEEDQRRTSTADADFGDDAPRIVIDTNVLLDILHWKDPGVEALTRLVDEGRLLPVRDEATLLELAEVMDRTNFAIGFENVTNALQTWTRKSLPAAVPEQDNAPKVICRDPLDQKFLDLALACGAAILVTKDKLVLKTRRKMALRGCAVVRPEDVPAALEAHLQLKKK